MKPYLPELGGVPMDADFKTHEAHCERCRTGDLAAMCLEGVILWKRANAAPIKREKPERDPHRVSKAELRKIMRYKGE